ncbi:MAG: KH domain-containing protein [Limisphaerales bacterium]|jgi:predicted RNA-binding protein YlqC (UPF0109 family)|nr:KH domain-containing protein [Verrucomicrobiota bacterium]
MQEFLEYVIKNLVEEPEDVSIRPVERNGVTVYELRVSPVDTARVIGRKGSTINAIRALLIAGSARQGKRSVLELIEEVDGPEMEEDATGGEV